MAPRSGKWIAVDEYVYTKLATGNSARKPTP